MKFSSANEMLDYVQDNNDIWSPELEFYVFLYSEYGSICYYRIDKEEAIELEQLAKKREPKEYWAAFLGVGGRICDTIEWYENAKRSGMDINSEQIDDYALLFCEETFRSEWIDCKDVVKETIWNKFN